MLGPLLHNPDPDKIKGRARYLLELSPHLGRSLRSRWARWETGKWSQFDVLVINKLAPRPRRFEELS